jgi:hypothetical protein
MRSLKDAIIAVVEGDLKRLSAVLEARHSDLLASAAEIPRLTLTRNAIILAMVSWDDGCVDRDTVQKWASFVRRGYVSNENSGAIRPIDIEYDEQDEELIADFIGRLDQIGDMIDGCIDGDERTNMLQYIIIN